MVILERGPELAWGCSAGNAGIVGSSHVVPLADPTAVRNGIRWMARPDSPFFVRPRLQVLPWLARFAAAARPAHVKRHRAVLRELETLVLWSISRVRSARHAVEPPDDGDVRCSRGVTGEWICGGDRMVTTRRARDASRYGRTPLRRSRLASAQ